MLTDKQLKEKYKPTFWKNPDKYYATSVLKENGFVRNYCKKCRKPFWNLDANREYCGDPSCGKEEAFGFINKSPAKNKLNYLEVWKEFSKMFDKLGYKPIKRYPTVARWNPTMEYTNASIAAFQPFVISGETEPPANPLVIPQFCLRFGDIDNVGITMSHMTCFNMIGQHMFVKPEEWDQEKVFRDIKLWLNKGLGLNDKEIIFHEDAWAGGGNLGCCMEFFSRGCEIGNQVYMLYEQTEKGIKDLNIKVLDMGMGMERNSWFSLGCNTIYDAAFPKTIKKLVNETRIEIDDNLIRKYVPYAGLLNIDETEDVDKEWMKVSKKLNLNVKELKEKIMSSAALYSIAEHSRGLLIALNDGALPSNVGGGYNLRLIARRMLGFIDNYKWNVDVKALFEWHSEELKELWPEFKENLEEIYKIFEVEKNKYEASKQKVKGIVSGLVDKDMNENELIRLYDTQGIDPMLIKQEFDKAGKKIEIPDNFYARVSELHEKIEQKHETKKTIDLDLKDVKETRALYFDDWKKMKFNAEVIKQIGKYLILDKTYFYPTSGGQMHDLGKINNVEVVNVFKQGNIIVHELKDDVKFKTRQEVSGDIDWNRRLQLAQNHSSAHILNAACRIVLGKHANQAGAFKDVDKSRLDITHYSALGDNELKKIEEEANKIIEKGIPIKKSFMPRNEAEKKFGMTIYQGGVPIGKELRIVDIYGTDVECCGGTHLDNTKEAEKIKILNSKKISDSIVRIEYAAGNSAFKELSNESKILEECARLLNCNKKQVPSRAKELFGLWKDIVKKKKNIKFELKSKDEDNLNDAELLDMTAIILKTQPEYITNTIKRFLKEIKK